VPPLDNLLAGEEHGVGHPVVEFFRGAGLLAELRGVLVTVASSSRAARMDECSCRRR
jgi:hypothetical protein